MFILFFAESFGRLAFKNQFCVSSFDRIQALTCIRESAGVEGPQIVSPVEYKENGHSKQLKGSTINSESNKVLLDIGTKQLSQMFWGMTVIHKYTIHGQSVGCFRRIEERRSVVCDGRDHGF